VTAAIPSASESPSVHDSLGPRPATASEPLDDAADVPDTAATLAEEITRRAEVIMLAHQSLQQDQQAKLDRIRANFNATQEEHTEMLREMNALRDMAMEQSKKDDEILKKYIAMI
jgi:hypothetical protein